MSRQRDGFTDVRDVRRMRAINDALFCSLDRSESEIDNPFVETIEASPRDGTE